jgi:hypothetical protein
VEKSPVPQWIVSLLIKLVLPPSTIAEWNGIVVDDDVDDKIGGNEIGML